MANPAQTPTAIARFSGGNTLVIVDRVPGMISAAPMPVIARKAMSDAPLSASADRIGADAEQRRCRRARAPRRP